MSHPVVHTEIRSQDPDATREFFADLFGWKVASEGAFPGYTFIDTGAEGGPYVAIGPRQGADDEVLFFVAVEDVTATLQRPRARRKDHSADPTTRQPPRLLWRLAGSPPRRVGCQARAAGPAR